ncbi:MAG: glycosyl transferase [Anaerolineales bacterium]|nr:glycosyl transferase [Anaerolineales bacterium]
MKFGYFDDEHREYVITQPDTPLPWINFLGCEEYFGIISNTAGGYSFFKDARLRRLTRYRYNNAPLDSGGRYIYLRDDESSESSSGPFYWSPSWQPTRHTLDLYECRHGMGYTSIRSRLGGIETQTRYFVPLGENLEIWEMTITNQHDKSANLSIFSAVEFCLWDALDDATNFQRNYSIGEVEIDKGVIYHKSEYRERRDHFAFFACSEPVVGFDTDRDAFLGPYRGWDSPRAVEKGQMQGSIAHGWQPIGANQIKLQLDPGEQHKIIFILGYHENQKNEKFDPPGSQIINKKTVKPIIARYLQADAVESAFISLQRHYQNIINTLQVTTPDQHTNRMVNIWTAYQLMVTFNFSRSASYFESGIGRGMGFRDTTQDLIGFVQFFSEKARERILDVAATQLPTGGAYHQYQPLTKRGNNDVGSGFNDDPLWLVLSVAAYLKETGEWNILEEMIPYDNTAGTEEPLYGHLLRSIQYTLDRLGPHGLPLIGRADWNDCLNLNCYSDIPGQSFQTTTNKEGLIAESVFIAGLFILAAKEMLKIGTKLESMESGKTALKGISPISSDFLIQKISTMEKTVWKAGWDGEWFRRAYDDNGDPVGSKECKEGQIFIEPQGMCIMAGLGLEDGQARQALESVGKRLATPHGIVLHQPAYTHYYLNLGEISSYPPGYKENAGVFCHTNPWVMIAEAKIGRGDQAFEYYSRINPSVREELSEVHRCEPYIYAQMISGIDAARPGEAKNSWLTGTASWNYIAITQWILGIRPTYEGLQISPVMPTSWNGFRAKRLFRGVNFDIQVDRVGPGNLVSLEMDGKHIPGNVIPLPRSFITQTQVVVKVGK